MLPNIKKTILYGVIFSFVFIISIIIFYALVKARSGLTSSPGDKLTSAKWNDMANTVTTLQSQLNALSGQVNGDLVSVDLNSFNYQGKSIDANGRATYAANEVVWTSQFTIGGGYICMFRLPEGYNGGTCDASYGCRGIWSIDGTDLGYTNTTAKSSTRQSIGSVLFWDSDTSASSPHTITYKSSFASQMVNAKYQESRGGNKDAVCWKK